jgi:hypothetical protein
MLQLLLLLAVFWIGCAECSPSSVFWTNCTTNVYETGDGHVDEDNYLSVFNRRGHGSTLPPDTGLEFGIFTVGDWSAEAGIDYLGGTDDPLYFNMGIAIKEDLLFSHAPSFKVGFFNAGTRYHGKHATNQNVVDLIIGHSLPEPLGGTMYIGAFSGTRAMGKNRQGFMAAYQKYFCPAIYCDDTEYHKWVFCADYASGKNTIGGGGVAIGYYFTPMIDILTGPTFFNSAKYNGSWKWSVQIDVTFDAFRNNL